MSSIYIARHGKSLGSFNEEEVREGIASKRFVQEDLVWRAGMNDWLPLHEVADAWGFDTSTLGGTAAEMIKPPVCTEPAWERREEVGFLSALYQTIKMVLLAPNITFSKLRTTGGMLIPLLYYVIMTSFSFTITMLFQLPQILKNPSLLGPQLATFSQHAIIAGFFGLILISPFIFIIGILFSSAVTHLSLKIIKGAQEPFEATFRVFCYALGSVAIFQILPFLGGIIGAIWGVVAYFIGLKKVHALSGARTSFAILISVAIYSTIVIIVAIAGTFISARYFH